MIRTSRRAFLGLVPALAAMTALGEAAKPPARSKVVIIEPRSSAPRGELKFALALCRHLKRWIESGGVTVDLVGDDAGDVFVGRRLAILVMCQNPGAGFLKSLKTFSQKGGRIISFYSTSGDIASLMGVKLGRWHNPKAGTYAEMSFFPGGPKGSPKAIAQASSSIFTASHIEGRSKTLAVWRNRRGESMNESAIISSPQGWWVTHVFLADGDERAKALFLLAAIGESVPGAWDYEKWAREDARRRAADVAFAKAQKPSPGEIVAVWDHSGQGLYPGDWAKTMRTLKVNHVTDIFVNVCGAGFAHFESKVLPRSKVVSAEGDQLKAAIAAARGTGVRVHAWMIVFNATRAVPGQLQLLDGMCARLRDPAQEGKWSEYLDPSSPVLRDYLLRAMEDLVSRYPVDGLHLDFIRWYEKIDAAEKTPATLARFFKASKDHTRGALLKWRARTIETFLSSARTRVKAIRPHIAFTTAVFGKYPASVDSVGQDWESWMDLGLVDRIVPMNYTEDMKTFSSWVARQGRTWAHARKTIAGIGVTANESRLTARQVMDQVLAARRARLAGVAFFDLDHTLVNEILPVLRQGVI